MDQLREALTESRDGTIISIEVTASAKRNAFPSGYNPWRKTLGCQVREPPTEGKANLAIVRLLAGFFSLPVERVQILSGAGSSQKRILLAGMQTRDVLEILERARERER